jgi:ATP-dependent helicase/nuclease subunit A
MSRLIPPEARDVQVRASDPRNSVFVSANAGSGKTHVLVQRVIRLLLDGVPPERILCVTFTKAAAANMAERVFTTLGDWVTLSDDDLVAALQGAGIHEPNARTRRQARELFARALETPGGLKVQTIHALCTRLLQQFPFEANVPARFAVMDDRDEAEMMERASMDVLLEAAATPDSAEGRALAVAITSAADVTFRDVVREACRSRDRFLAWVERSGGTQEAAAQLAHALEVEASDSLEAIEHEMLDGPYLKRTRWEAVAMALEGGGKTDNDNAARLRTALAGGPDALDCYLKIFFTTDMEPRKSLLTKAVAQANSSLADAMRNECERLSMLLQRRRAVAAYTRSAALLTIATRVAQNYRREKQARGLLDYDDLIDKTLAMLNGRVSPGWVHYKLDRGIDHVLIDEAQDTSPRQWDIIDSMIADFASGEGAREGVRRTVFAVGDEKQSIFSFQGAAPREFDSRRRALTRRFSGAGLPFETIAFKHSFRSGAALLHSVDLVFRDEEIYRSIHAVENGYPIHESLADAGPSVIDLWPLEPSPQRPEIEGWRAALDSVSKSSPIARLADRVVGEIRSLIDNRSMTGPRHARRPLRYGDILVLVRRRGAAFDAVIQALKHSGIPVAGADRLKLTEHIAIIDLMNLADALLLPQDDLALAVALKSPLFGLDDDDLFTIAWDRRGTLRDALTRHAKDHDKFAAALRRLQACERRSIDTPFAFYSWLLGGDQGRARTLRRLGPEANDALDEFLQLALSYEQRAPASLQGFMAWLRAADTEVKRDMEISRDEVRVMTVHGAKGLEAPVVFLIDTTASPADRNRPGLLHLSSPVPGAHGPTVWPGKKDEDPPILADARAAREREEDDEYRRLLYVAMTRAADRLIVGGCMPGNRKEMNPRWWYAMIARGLEGSELVAEPVPPDGVVMRYSRPDSFVDTPGALAVAGETTAPVPGWLRSPAAPSPAVPGVLRPSDSDPEEAIGAKVEGGDIAETRQAARRRGVLVHRLLQSLPDLAPERRGIAAARFLAQQAQDWSEADRATLAADVLRLLDAPQLAALFAPGSRAEVPIVGRVTRGGAPTIVSGQVDRLVVTPAEVTIADYKSGPRPATPPPAYVRQLALYRVVLASLYPGRTIRAALVWTQAPELAEVPPAMLDAAARSALA